MFQAAAAAVNLLHSSRLTMERVCSAAEWWLAPPRCVLCAAPGSAPQLDLCGHCAASLPVQADVWRPHAMGFDAVLNPWRYAWPADAMLRALKFRGERSYGRVLGTLLGQARRAAAAPLPQCVVPLPLHPQRRRQRGYNQAEELARGATAVLALPLRCDLLIRIRNTDPQSGLHMADRGNNIRYAFSCPAPLTGLHLALVDDVATTGSTALAALAALRVAGAGCVEFWVAAQVERDHQTAGQPQSLARP
jgi:ComF family protein